MIKICTSQFDNKSTNNFFCVEYIFIKLVIFIIFYIGTIILYNMRRTENNRRKLNEGYKNKESIK